MRDYRETLNLRKPMAHARIVRRERYAWPGGYLLILVTSDSSWLCPDCVRDQWREISSATRRKDTRCGWHPAGLVSMAGMDDSEYCDHCGSELGSL